MVRMLLLLIVAAAASGATAEHCGSSVKASGGTGDRALPDDAHADADDPNFEDDAYGTQLKHAWTHGGSIDRNGDGLPDEIFEVNGDEVNVTDMVGTRVRSVTIYKNKEIVAFRKDEDLNGIFESVSTTEIVNTPDGRRETTYISEDMDADGVVETKKIITRTGKNRIIQHFQLDPATGQFVQTYFYEGAATQRSTGTFGAGDGGNTNASR